MLILIIVIFVTQAGETRYKFLLVFHCNNYYYYRFASHTYICTRVVAVLCVIGVAPCCYQTKFPSSLYQCHGHAPSGGAEPRLRPLTWSAPPQSWLQRADVTPRHATCKLTLASGKRHQPRNRTCYIQCCSKLIIFYFCTDVFFNIGV